MAENESESLSGATPSSTETSEVPAAVQDAFDRVFGGEAAATAAQDAADTEEAELAELAGAKDDTAGSATDDEQTDEEAGLKPPVAKPRLGQEAPTASTLPAHLRQAAKRAGYTDAEIDDDVKTFGVDRVMRSMERLHGGFNDVSRRYAELGLAMQRGQAPAQQPPANQPPAAPVSALDKLFDPKALAEFAENNGTDLVEKFIKPLQAELVAPVREMQAWVDAQKTEALRNTVTSVFDRLAGEFADVYGKGAVVGKDHLQARSEVAHLADRITAGAAAQGIDLSVTDALEQAHGLFVADRQAEVQRKRIAGQVTRRSNSITARPTQRNGKAGTAAKGVEAAMAAYAQRAAEIGVEV
jgi:hypothetical protein